MPSWKASAGRMTGPDRYRFGDRSRALFFRAVRPRELRHRNEVKRKMVNHFPKVKHILTAELAQLLDPQEQARACFVCKDWNDQWTHVLIVACNTEIQRQGRVVVAAGPNQFLESERYPRGEGKQVSLAAAYYKRAMFNEARGNHARAYDDFKQAVALSAARGVQGSVHASSLYHQAKCAAVIQQTKQLCGPSRRGRVQPGKIVLAGVSCPQGRAVEAAIPLGALASELASVGSVPAQLVCRRRSAERAIELEGLEAELDMPSDPIPAPLAEDKQQAAVQLEDEDELLRRALASDPAFAAAALRLSGNYSKNGRFCEAKAVLMSAIEALRQYHLQCRQGSAKGVHSLGQLYFALGVLLEGPGGSLPEAVTAFSRAMEHDRRLLTQVIERKSMLYVLPAVPFVLPVLLTYKTVRYAPWAAGEVISAAGRAMVATHRHVIVPAARSARDTTVAGAVAVRGDRKSVV